MPADELQALLDAAVDGIVIIDHRGDVQRINHSSEKLFGYGAAEMIGQNIRMLMTEADCHQHDAHLARYLQTRIAHIIGTGREVHVRRKDGSVFPARLTVGVVQLSEPPRFVGFIHDISEQRHSEAEAIRLQDRIMHVSRLATIGEMASGIAHELNQPLAAIATYAQACDRLLGFAKPDISEVQGALREIAGQAVRAGDIIRRLRGIARADETHREPEQINAIIEELTDLLQSDAKSKKTRYRLELDPRLPKVHVDRGQIQQVVLNLVRNALESFEQAPLTGREIVVGTSLTAQGDVEIRVADNGPGVSEQIVPRMFDPFCSTKPAGTGLGLAISRTIVRMHQGSLRYQPNFPQGACFVVRLSSTSPDPP